MEDMRIGLLIGISSILIFIIGKMKGDILRINAKLNLITQQIEIPYTATENLKQELKQLIAEGKKVEAVKIYRIATGAGLLEAKEYVDSLLKEIN